MFQVYRKEKKMDEDKQNDYECKKYLLNGFKMGDTGADAKKPKSIRRRGRIVEKEIKVGTIGVR